MPPRPARKSWRGQPPAPSPHLRSAASGAERSPGRPRRFDMTPLSSPELRSLECPSSDMPRAVHSHAMSTSRHHALGRDHLWPRHRVPPSWFFTTSADCSSSWFQVYCNLVPEGVRCVSPWSTDPHDPKVDGTDGPGPRNARTLRRIPPSFSSPGPITVACMHLLPLLQSVLHPRRVSESPRP